METLRKQIVPEVHGYLIEGWWEHFGSDFEKCIKGALGNKTSIIRFEGDTLGIDDVRNITELQSRKSAESEAFIVGSRTMTREAQNALLKVAEEPTVNTYFFIVVPYSRILLPTLRSRLFALEHEVVSEQNTLVEEFLSVGPSERLKLLEGVIKEKNAAVAHMFFDKLVETLYEGMKKKDPTEAEYRALEEVMQARIFLTGRGASLKLLLEHIALVTP